MSALERRGPFMSEALRFVPSYDVLKVWCCGRSYPGQWARFDGLPPSCWPPGWRPDFVRRLGAGLYPVLYAAGEDEVDRRRRCDGGPTDDERIAAWVARERRAA